MAGISEEQPVVSREPAQLRGPGRPFRPGQSGNPSGRPKGLAALEAQIRELHGPLALEVIERLRGLALAGNVVAAKLYLERVLGPARAMRETIPSLPTPDASGAGLHELLNPTDLAALDMTKRILRVIAGQVAALEEKAADVGLLPEESSALADHLTAVAHIGRWHFRTEATYEKQIEALPLAIGSRRPNECFARHLGSLPSSFRRSEPDRQNPAA